MKVVINRCFGGFGLSPEGIKRYAELSGFDVFSYQTDYKSNDFSKTIRWNDGDSDFCIFWLKQDIGDNPSKEELNKAEWFHEHNVARDDKTLIQVVSELGDKANTRFSKLTIVDIPDDVEWEIDEYDGLESIHENHRTWV